MRSGDGNLLIAWHCKNDKFCVQVVFLLIHCTASGEHHAKLNEQLIHPACLAPMVKVQGGIFTLEYSVELSGRAVLRDKNDRISLVGERTGASIYYGITDQAAVN